MPKKRKMGFMHANVKPVETDELAKSIAKDLKLPDRPLTIQELAATDPFTGEPRERKSDEVRFCMDHEPVENVKSEREDEGFLIDKIDAEFDE